MRGLIARMLGEPRLAVVSGGFDPIHSGHLAMIEAAEEYGSVVVILNSDEWLARKKGAPFMEWDERNAIVAALRVVAMTWRGRDDDDTVIASLDQIRLVYPQHIITFCNGGDRVSGNTPEEEFCRTHGIELAYGVGGGKTQSSSALIARAQEKGLSQSPR